MSPSPAFDALCKPTCPDGGHHESPAFPRETVDPARWGLLRPLMLACDAVVQQPDFFAWIAILGGLTSAGLMACMLAGAEGGLGALVPTTGPLPVMRSLWLLASLWVLVAAVLPVFQVLTLGGTYAFLESAHPVTPWSVWSRWGRRVLALYRLEVLVPLLAVPVVCLSVLLWLVAEALGPVLEASLPGTIGPWVSLGVRGTLPLLPLLVLGLAQLFARQEVVLGGHGAFEALVESYSLARRNLLRVAAFLLVLWTVLAVASGLGTGLVAGLLPARAAHGLPATGSSRAALLVLEACLQGVLEVGLAAWSSVALTAHYLSLRARTRA